MGYTPGIPRLRPRMNPQDYQILRALYHGLSELPEPEWRDIVTRAELSPELRGELEALLGHQAQAGIFEEERLGVLPASLVDAHTVVDARSTAAGAGEGESASPSAPAAEGETPVLHIGGFRIEGELGRGGMGVVYRAIQEQPPREVALKVMASFSFDEAARRRFEYEAEILARLDHACIAKIYQAGIDHSTPAGTPYIAMELVNGVDILGYFEATSAVQAASDTTSTRASSATARRAAKRQCGDASTRAAAAPAARDTSIASTCAATSTRSA